ncbi:PASTA domain-containing protein [Streptomyces sp. NPDC046805]|uniref:PASTA domain-containing protein n=1 Tax=Streptomyces sp. NPDC046805 TaxID=3155134 RepID=UPI0033D1CD07
MNPRNTASSRPGGRPPQQPPRPLTSGEKKWIKRLGIGALIFALGTGCGSAGGDGKPAAKAKPAPTVTVTATVTVAPEPMTSQVSKALGAATTVAKKHGYKVSAHDASEKDATPGDDWGVCFEKVTYDTVDYAAVPHDAPCPKTDGKPITWPTMPTVVGSTYAHAAKNIGKLTHGDIALKASYKDEEVDVGNATDGDYDAWKVCFQSPQPGTRVTDDAKVTLWLTEEACPSQKGTYKDKTNDPNYTPPAASDSGSSTSSSTSSTSASGSGSSGSASTSTTCEIVSNAGNCYNAGQFCRASDVGSSTHAGNGRLIYCRDEGSVNRWNY